VSEFEGKKRDREADFDLKEGITETHFHYRHHIDPLTYRLLQEFFDRQKDHITRKISAARLT
jgi:hypothetical protein